MTDYAIGDIQGCYDPLRRVLDKVRFDPASDRLRVVGDIVNRGPESLRTLRFIRDLGQSAQAVLGNHDLHLLALVFNGQTPSPKDTLSQILDASDAPELIDWLRDQPLALYDEARDLFMAHAGLPHIWDVPQALGYAEEVSAVVRGAGVGEYFATMYGNQPERWSAELSGTERWRVITNYLTRMRFIAADGSLELTAKEDGRQAPGGYQPWFRYPRTRDNTRVIFGHWAALKGITGSRRFIGLDTGCVWGGAMTVMNLDTFEQTRCECGK